MLDNSVSVISSAARKVRKYHYIFELVAQIVFISYYVYLLVTHYKDIVFFVAYTTLLVLGFLILFIKIFDLDPYDKKGHDIKKKWKKAMRFVSWAGRVTVIGYNVYSAMQNGITEIARLFLIFSAVILILEIILFIVSSISSRYYDLLLYALKMDYEFFNRDEKELAKKPIARILNDVNDGKDFEVEVSELYIEHEIFDTIKRYLEDDDLALNFRRRELEKLLLSYYNKTQSYYYDVEYLVQLLKDINNMEKNPDIAQYLYVLKFLLINHIDHVYRGLSKQSTRLVLCGLSLYRDKKEPYIIELIFLTIIKQLIIDLDWNEYVPERQAEFSGKRKPFDLTTPEKMIDEVNRIIKASKEEYEIYEQGTVTGELKNMATKHVTKTVKKTIKSTFRSIFKRK